MAQPAPARGVAAGHPPVPRRAHRDLVGGRGQPRRVGPGRGGPAGGGHHRPGRLPPHSTWYLPTNRPRPGGPRAAGSPYPAADLAEVVRCYGLRNWVEQGYKQVKDELGWADFQVRSDHRDPPPPDPGLRGVLVLLAGLVHPSATGY